MGKKISKEKLDALIAMADVKLAGTYHSIYERFGAKKGRGGNFHCFNEAGHSGGFDVKPSMGIDNNTGVYNCFACGTKGNLYTYWKEFLKKGDEYYHDFLSDELDISVSDTDDGDYSEANVGAIRDLYHKYAAEYQTISGMPHIIDDAVVDDVSSSLFIDMSILDEYVDRLLNNEAAMKYLFDERRITKENIIKYRIGITEGRSGVPNSKAFTFPIISPEGKLVNIKLYNPITDNLSKKWLYMYRDKPMFPGPTANLADDRLFFFEGEPDTYCASAFGIHGAITMGAAVNSDPIKILGESTAKRLISNKEIVICFDADEAGRVNAEKLAMNVYPYARQVKIVDLDKSEINPYGLDPTLVKTIHLNGKVKEKRIEKDFTEFMKKNGFNETAYDRFKSLVNSTNAYTDNRDRSERELYKVTIHESRLPKYHSEYKGIQKRVQFIGSVSDLDNNAYMYYDALPVECPMMGSADIPKKCEYCSLPSMKSFANGLIKLNIKRHIPKLEIDNLEYVKATEKDILELIEVSEKNRQAKLKSLCGINNSCTQVRFREGHPVKISHVQVVRDISFHIENKRDLNNNDVEVDVYVENYDVEGGRSYLFEGVQTTSPNGQYVAVYVDHVEPMLTSVEKFEMNHDIHEQLKVFRPVKGETIWDCLAKRYDQYGEACKITGRHELFLMYDLVFFSAINFNSSIISDSVRRWIEVAVVGESRCGKSIAAEYLVNLYRFGEIFGCSNGVTRSGVLGGITKRIGGKNKIQWGVIPRNDGGLVVMDEFVKMNMEILSDMTPSRTSGIVDIEMSVSGKALARTRKIFVSNPRVWEEVNGQAYEGIAAIKGVFPRDEIIQRFDYVYFVRIEDQPIETYKDHYDSRSSYFTDLQCRNLLMWAHSRKPDDYVWEDGEIEFNKYATEKARILNEMFHNKMMMFGPETTIRLIKSAVSMAGILYSTLPEDYNKIFIKKEFVDFTMNFMIQLYTSKNMRFDEFCNQMKSSESLGDMRFLENICKYVSVESIIREKNFNEKSIQQVFFDYLYRVSDKTLYMVDASNDKSKMTGLQPHISVHKLAQTLVARNCLTRTKWGFDKTPMFTEWLDKMKGANPDELSNILEYERDPEEVNYAKHASELVKEFEKRK